MIVICKIFFQWGNDAWRNLMPIIIIIIIKVKIKSETKEIKKNKMECETTIEHNYTKMSKKKYK